MNIKLLSDRAIIPTRGSEYSAGLDLYSAEDATIFPNSTRAIHTDIAMEIPPGYFGGIYARSGLSTKHGLRPANCVGVIDSDYRGEIIVCLHNDNTQSYTIQEGERIAQIIIQPYLHIPELTPADELEETIRGESGFGDSGKF